MRSTRPRTPRFPRSLKIGIEESDLALRHFERAGGGNRRMIDVGAHRGTATRPFADAGWRVHAFEPDPSNRELFVRAFGAYDNVTIDERAVSDVDGATVTLFDSTESSGISSLVRFVDSHQPAVEVATIRLETFIAAEAIDHVDFLKVDTEGFDLMVLRSHSWETHRPEVVLCEYEDKKTNHLGYTTIDLIHLLEEQGYSIIVSEWHPIERYGVTHSFAQLRRFGGVVPDTASWGNILAVRDDADADAMIKDAHAVVQRRVPGREHKIDAARFEVWRRSRPFLTRSTSS